MSACTTTSSPWLRRMPNGGLCASKTSRSVLHGAAPGLATISEGATSALGHQALGARASGFGERAAAPAMHDVSVASPVSGCPSLAMGSGWPWTPTTTPRRTSQPVPVDVDSNSNSSDDESQAGNGNFLGRAVSVEDWELGQGQVVVIQGVRTVGAGVQPPMSSASSKSRQTMATDDNAVEIVRAHRVHTARARSRTINEIKQGPLPPPPPCESPSYADAPSHRPLPPLPLRPSRAPLIPAWSPLDPGPNRSPGTPNSASGSALSTLGSFTPATPCVPAPPRTILPRRRGPRSIAKDPDSLLEHIYEDSGVPPSHTCLNPVFRTARSTSLPGIARQRSEPAPNALPPPPRPRNRAHIRPATAPSQSPPFTPSPANTNLAPMQKSELSSQPPRLVLSFCQPGLPERPPPPPPKGSPGLNSRRESSEYFKNRHTSLHSLPSVDISLPPSAVTPEFPQSPCSTIFQSCCSGSDPASPQHSFLPSWKSTSDADTIKEESSPRVSEDRRDYIDRPYRTSALSTLSNPFGDFSFLRPQQRASGISFTSTTSGYSTQSPTEAESILIGLHYASHKRQGYSLPVSPRSSLLRDVGLGSGFEVDVHLPSEADEDEEDDESVTEEESKKSSVFGHERVKSLTLPHLSITSRNKVDRVLGRGAARALISGVHVHVPHLSISSMSSDAAPTDHSQPVSASTDPAQQSFLPSTTPSTASLMGSLGRRLSKKSHSAEGRRSEGVQRSSSGGPGGLIARMDRFIGRTPSPAGRTRELDSDDEQSSPPPILTFPRPTHGRKHSGSDPSVGLSAPLPGFANRPSTTNTRTPAERAEMLKKARKIQQLLGDVPPTSGAAGAFYHMSRAARSEDSLVTPTSARGEGFGILGSGPADDAKSAPTQGRGFHRSTASLSSTRLTPGPAILDLRIADDFGLGLVSPGATSTTRSVAEVEPEPEEPQVDIPETATTTTTVSGLDELDKGATEEEKTEDEATLARRARRAKMTKLHRYLGSRVPPHLVLGLDEDTWSYEQGLPGVRSEDEGPSPSAGSSLLLGGSKKRRASDGDYALIEDIGDLSVMSSEEKARAVRRKAKMEKMFGEHPPQKLYQPHTGADSPAVKNEGEAEDAEGEDELHDIGGGAYYRSYQASFNSLAYFVNNADRASLEGLYDIISGPGDEDEAQRSQFTARRKRAAKLSNLFGVSYRDLFGAVLDILESDVREDKEEGSLSAAETQDLLRKLRRLKAKGEGIRV